MTTILSKIKKNVYGLIMGGNIKTYALTWLKWGDASIKVNGTAEQIIIFFEIKYGKTHELNHMKFLTESAF